MRDQEIVGLWEAYSSIYESPDSDIVNENIQNKVSGALNKGAEIVKNIEKNPVLGPLTSILKPVRSGKDRGPVTSTHRNVASRQEQFETWVNDLVEEGYDLSDYTWNDMYEIYMEEVEQLDETRTDPRGRPASGPMNVYGGRGRDAGPGGSGDERTDRMDVAQRRVNATQPANKGRSASRLHTLYSWRRRGSIAGSEEGPGPKSPKRGGRKGRGAETDRGSGNAAARRMREEFEGDLFDYILEHLVAEGYADTNDAALSIMANMSEEWKQSIVEVSERGQKLAWETGQAANSALSRTTDPKKRAVLHGLSHAASSRSIGGEYPDTPDMMVGGKSVRTVHDIRRGGTGEGDPDSDRGERGGENNRSARRRRARRR